MKRIVSIILALLMIMVMVGCTKPAPAAPSASAPAAPSASAPAPSVSAPAPSVSAPVVPPASSAPPVEEYNPKTKKIGYVSGLRGNPVIQTIIMSYCNTMEELGYEPHVFTVDNNELAQIIAAGEAGLATGLDALIVYKDVSAMELYKSAEAQGVPTICIHFVLPENSGTGAMANILAEPYEIGRVSAKALGDELVRRNINSGSIGITMGAPAANVMENIRGFKDVMKEKYPQYKVLEEVEEGFDVAVVLQRQAAIVQSNSDLIGVYTPNGNGATHWALTLDSMGKPKGEVVVVGHDYTASNLDTIRNGQVYACIAQPLLEHVDLAVRAFDKYLRTGEKPASYTIHCNIGVITKDNVEDYQGIVEQVKVWFEKFNV